MEASRLPAISDAGDVVDEQSAKELTVEHPTLAVDAAEVEEIRHTFLVSHGNPASLPVVSEAQVRLPPGLLGVPASNW